MKKSELIKYINDNSSVKIELWQSYTYKDIKRFYNAIKQGKKLIKLGYEIIIGE